MALTDKLAAIADAIREKTGSSELMTLDAMPIVISGITVGEGGTCNKKHIPEEALTVTGNCTYRFSYGGWDWFIEEFGDEITVNNIANGTYMFTDSNVSNIPFEINFSSSETPISAMFYSCKYLTSLPKINYVKPNDTKEMFCYCQRLREIPQDYFDGFDWSAFAKLTSSYNGNRSGMFKGCYSLRSFPMEALRHVNEIGTTSYSVYANCFNACYALDEIINLPAVHLSSGWSTNGLTSSFTQCYRLKNLTFEIKEDGTPYEAKWKSQVIELQNVGFGTKYSQIDYNSGITEDKMVKDDETYAALKNDPDWFTTLFQYSRYNHDSAVNTINSLPDTSDYLASAGGTNTIKFNGNAGSATDGGAINTLTEEEIAVATAKGWTVTFA